MPFSNEIFKLVIKRQDGSTYWVEHFVALEELERWLAEERTRPYWDESYVPHRLSLDDMGVETVIEG